jgi:hypothetical protein
MGERFGSREVTYATGELHVLELEGKRVRRLIGCAPDAGIVQNVATGSVPGRIVAAVHRTAVVSGRPPGRRDGEVNVAVVTKVRVRRPAALHCAPRARAKDAQDAVADGG